VHHQPVAAAGPDVGRSRSPQRQQVRRRRAGLRLEELTVAVLDPDLRADAIRVSAAKQVYQNGAWVDSPVTAATVQKLEEIILTRARDLRRAAVRG